MNDEQVSAELPAATVRLNPRICLSEASVQTILSHCPSADIAEQTPTRLEVDMESGDWLVLGIWLINHPLPDVAFTKLNLNDDPHTVTVVFFNPNFKESFR